MEYEEDVIQLGKQAIKVNTRLATGRYGKLSDAQQKHADELVKKLRYLICYPAIDTPIPQETVGIPKEGPPSLTQPGEIPADDGLREQSDGDKQIPNELRGVADEALKIYNKLLDLAPKARSPNLEIALFHLCRSLESASSDWDCQPSSNSVSSSVTEPVARTPQSTAPSSNHDGFPTSTTLTPALITEICPANLAGHICYKRDCKMRLLCEV
ncbi:hypothetical protein FQN57_001367 [Myotisia sp. PD_48]|nr:hypothetical protein FQN57_001367 [Myotisia sp. PD_48]